MRILIIGSKGDTESGTETLESFCHELGAQLGMSEHEVCVCSARSDSADRHVLGGMRASGHAKVGKLFVHRPNDPKIFAAWEELEHELGLAPAYTSHSGPSLRTAQGDDSIEGIRNAFLLCQLAALKKCDIVVTVGGKTDGVAPVILAIARDQNKQILPFQFLGGAAAKVYNQLEPELQLKLEGDFDLLSFGKKGAAAILSMIERLQKQLRVANSAPPRVFLSYSWRRGEYADLIEAILRRKENVTVFRDEKEIHAGDTISEKIRLELTEKCNIFIALWSQEYVQSPHCYDEIHLWHEHHKMDGLILLRFDETRPVWPFLRKRDEDMNDFARVWPVIDLKKERRVIDKELADYIDRIRGKLG